MKYLFSYWIALSLVFLTGCSNSKGKTDEEIGSVTTPVEIASIQKGDLHQSVNLMATTVFLKKNQVKSTATGYISKTNYNIGDFVKIGSPLYIIKTKEADALAHFSQANPGFEVKGEITIMAPASGILTEISKQTNDYVADGEQLGIIADKSSLVFLLNVPYEQNHLIKHGQKCDIYLPDSTHVFGNVGSKLSILDAQSQTQAIIIKPNSSVILPENLTALAKVMVNTKEGVQIVQKQCVLTDETMEHYWVMKVINDSTAVRMAIKPGMITEREIEIYEPQFNPTDRFVISGHYGLSDTARISICHH